MKELFTDIYRKVAGFFQAPAEKESTKDEACSRLKFVLMQDRTNLNPQLLERMRGEMIDLLSKYVEMDKEALELSFEQEGESLALMLSIPVIRAKDEEEIQALIKADEEAKAKLEAEKAVEKSEDEQESEAESEEEIEETEEIEEIEETDEDLTEEVEEEVCACGCQDDEETQCTCGGECGCEDCDCGSEEEESEEPDSEQIVEKKPKKN